MTNLNETQYGCELVNDAEATQVTGGCVWMILPALAIGYGLWKGIDAAIGGRAAINAQGYVLDRQIHENQDARIAKGLLDPSHVSGR